MGKSRSATVCIAYLLHQQRGGLTPHTALELIRQCRPLCEPNDGFMEQLNLYHEMGCPDEVADHPVYQRWLYRREVEESVACGRAPEIKSVRFEDEQPQRPQEDTGRTVEIKCRKCRFVSPSRCSKGERLITTKAWDRLDSLHHFSRAGKARERQDSIEYGVCPCVFTPNEMDALQLIPRSGPQ